jgi:hypothetical protein
MTAQVSSGQVVFRVVDALRGPHSGWIMRLKVQEGKAPALGSFIGSRFRVEGKDGVSRTVLVKGFPVTGGKTSDARLQATGRIDLHVEVVDGPEGDILLRSLVRPA